MYLQTQLDVQVPWAWNVLNGNSMLKGPGVAPPPPPLQKSWKVKNLCNPRRLETCLRCFLAAESVRGISDPACGI